jgi:hypothetical protein
MPIGKSRERRQGRRAAPSPHDPADTEAYEHSWYALLAQHVEGVPAPRTDVADEGGLGDDPGDDHDGDPKDDPEDDLAPEAEPGLATVTELVVASTDPDPELDLAPDPGEAAARPPARHHPSVTARSAAPELVPPVGPERPTIRLGIRRVADPESIYLRYLTTSRHRDFFRADVWPSSRTISPVQLWRANHLGAGWELEQVERFLRERADVAGSLVAAAPTSGPPGSPERRMWMERLLSSAWVSEYGLARVSKTLFPLVPDLVPDLDPELTSFARARWFGIGETDGADEIDRALETWELLEDMLVLRGRALAAIARRLRSLAPGLAPVGPLGLVLAVLWEDRWAEPEPAAASPRRKAAARSKAAGPSAAAPVSPKRAGSKPTRARATPPSTRSSTTPKTTSPRSAPRRGG